MKLLLMSGGRHPYEESTPVLEGFLRAAGHDVTVREDADALTDGTLSAVDILVFNTLREGEMALNSMQQKAMENEIEKGKGFVCIHISGCVPDTWNDYGNITGGGWVMNKSFHPPYGKVQVKISDPNHPCVIDVPDFITNDELYMGIKYKEGNNVFMYASSQDQTHQWRNEDVFMPGGDFPLGWTRKYGEGRVFVTLLGHDGLSFLNPQFQKIILNGVKWVTDSV